MNVEIVIFDGFDELDALAPYEVIRHAVKRGATAEVALTAFGGPRPVTGGNGVTVLAEREPSTGAELILVPGGGWMDRAAPGAYAEVQRGEIPAFLAASQAAGATLAAVCTGGMLLAHAGVLTGRPATTHHQAMEELADAGAVPLEGRVVDDGEILTAGGITSGLDLALHLVSRFWGEAIADEVAQHIEYERRELIFARAS